MPSRLTLPPGQPPPPLPSKQVPRDDLSRQVRPRLGEDRPGTNWFGEYESVHKNRRSLFMFLFFRKYSYVDPQQVESQNHHYPQLSTAQINHKTRKLRQDIENVDPTTNNKAHPSLAKKIIKQKNTQAAPAISLHNPDLESMGPPQTIPRYAERPNHPSTVPRTPSVPSVRTPSTKRFLPPEQRFAPPALVNSLHGTRLSLPGQGVSSDHVPQSGSFTMPATSSTGRAQRTPFTIPNTTNNTRFD
jgi:hypothetical protein